MGHLLHEISGQIVVGNRKGCSNKLAHTTWRRLKPNTQAHRACSRSSDTLSSLIFRATKYPPPRYRGMTHFIASVGLVGVRYSLMLDDFKGGDEPDVVMLDIFLPSEGYSVLAAGVQYVCAHH